MNKRIALLIVPAWLFGIVIAQGGEPQNGGRRTTVWDGVYTEAQAAAGQPLMGQCRGCHGADMGGGQAPALRGEKFVDYWREDTLDSLYSLIKNTMPPRANSTLSEEQAVGIVSYLLQESGFPAGNTELRVDAMAAIQVEGKNGPQPLPNYAVIQAVGCTAKGAGDTWTLTQSTEPIRAKISGRANELELKAAAVKTLGNQTLQLQNLAMAGIDGSSLQEGRKMLVKGALIRQPNGDRIGINSLQEVGNCAP